MAARIQNSLSQHTRAVLLDFDGTLGATLSAWTDAFDDALRVHGITVPYETVITYCFHSRHDEVLRSHGIANGEDFKERVRENVVQRMSHATPYPEATEALAALRERGFKMAVVSNSHRSAVQPVLSRWGWDHVFDTVVTIEDVSHGKPDPEIIHRALNKLNSSPSHAYIIGDSKSDVIAGKRAGVKTIAFSPPDNWKYQALEALRGTTPSYLIHSFRELWDVLGLHEPCESPIILS